MECSFEEFVQGNESVIGVSCNHCSLAFELVFLPQKIYNSNMIEKNIMKNSSQESHGSYLALREVFLSFSRTACHIN